MSQTPIDINSLIPAGWEGRYPPCMIQVDPNGELSHQGSPITHPAVRETVFQNVSLEDGVYVLDYMGKRCQLEVADTLFVVRSVDIREDGALITLNDGSVEKLEPAGVYIGPGEVLYCQVREGVFPARFLRPAYYQMAEHVEPAGEGFVLRLAGQAYPLVIRS